MKLKTIAVGAAVLFAFGLGAYMGLSQQFDTPPLPIPEAPRHSQTIADLRRENLALRTEVDQLKAANARMAAPPVAAPAPVRPVAPTPAPAPLAVADQQRMMMNNLRQLAAAADQFKLENGRWPASSEELVGETKYVRKLVPVDGEDYSALSFSDTQPLTVTTLSGVSVTFDLKSGVASRQPAPPPAPPLPPHIVELQKKLNGPAQAAVQAYRAANNGAAPPQTEAGGAALLRYFTNPQDGADFVEYMEALKQAGRLPP